MGGYSPRFDDLVLELGGPRVCFVPTPSGDAPPIRFYESFAHRAEATHVSFNPWPRADLAEHVLAQDAARTSGTALAWPGQASGHSHVWRATREFASLAELLASIDWGPLDLLLIDLPPGPERTAQFVEFLGARAAVLLVSIPSALAHGVVARAADALRPLPNRMLGYVENMSGYACPGCGRVHPLFPSDGGDEPLDLACLGRVPFDPELARLGDAGLALAQVDGDGERPAFAAVAGIATELTRRLEEAR